MLVFLYSYAFLQFNVLGAHFGRMEDDVLLSNVVVEVGRQSRPIEKFDEERKVAFADGLLQIPKGGVLPQFQVVRMTDDKVEVAGVVRGSGDSAAVGPDFFVRKVSSNEAAQLFEVTAREGKTGSAMFLAQGFVKRERILFKAGNELKRLFGEFFAVIVRGVVS